MTVDELRDLFAETCAAPLPLPGGGDTAGRHLRLFAVAQQDVSLAKLAEAHWDALAILAEAGHVPEPGALYAVWASEIPGKPLLLSDGKLSGEKAFCSGFGLVDRALVTVETDGRLLNLDVRPSAALLAGPATWATEAFRSTNTGSVIFRNLPVAPETLVGGPEFYLHRPGFWHGACGPAACWAGAVAGLVDFADESRRADPHTLAHLAAMHANIWVMRSILQTAGREIDVAPHDGATAQHRALVVRHSIEQLATDTLRRFARAFGPVPLTMHEQTARRYHEADIFLRQSHGERDLEALGSLIRQEKVRSLDATRAGKS